MVKFLIIVGINLLLNTTTYANYTVDVYGASEQEAAYILTKYAHLIQKLAKTILPIGHKSRSDPLRNEKAWQEIENLKKKIKNEYHFLYVDFSIVNYFKLKPSYFITIEIIRPEDRWRLQFLQTAVNPKPNAKLRPPQEDDIIKQMIHFNDLEAKLLRNHHLKHLKKSCLAYHCTPGFYDEKLQPYLKLFNDSAIKHRKFILSTLKNDLDLERKGAAIFLIGHFKNPQDIISILSPYIEDKNPFIRNKAMLIIATAMRKAHISQINLSAILHYLNSPFDTDRNKVLGILAESIPSLLMKKQIIGSQGLTLIKLLQLKQPNNHDLAYLVLKQISGKDFGEYNIAAWKKWLSSAGDPTPTSDNLP